MTYTARCPYSGITHQLAATTLSAARQEALDWQRAGDYSSGKSGAHVHVHVLRDGEHVETVGFDLADEDVDSTE